MEQISLHALPEPIPKRCQGLAWNRVRAGPAQRPERHGSEPLFQSGLDKIVPARTKAGEAAEFAGIGVSAGALNKQRIHDARRLAAPEAKLSAARIGLRRASGAAVRDRSPVRDTEV